MTPGRPGTVLAKQTTISTTHLFVLSIVAANAPLPQLLPSHTFGTILPIAIPFSTSFRVSIIRLVTFVFVWKIYSTPLPGNAKENT
ncbi:hypothetical protein BLOT_013445 [Blomia tropicalis]|nr:hypothetical protein BLOT_013445 [Blomia tropicalis]